MASYDYLDKGNPDGTILGYASTSLIGFYGATPADQYANISTVTTTAATTATPYGYSTSTQADAIVTAINSILACLIEKGFVASS